MHNIGRLLAPYGTEQNRNPFSFKYPGNTKKEKKDEKHKAKYGPSRVLLEAHTVFRSTLMNSLPPFLVPYYNRAENLPAASRI